MSQKLPLASGTNSLSQMSSALDQFRSNLSVSHEVNRVARKSERVDLAEVLPKESRVAFNLHHIEL